MKMTNGDDGDERLAMVMLPAETVTTSGTDLFKYWRGLLGACNFIVEHTSRPGHPQLHSYAPPSLVRW